MSFQKLTDKLIVRFLIFWTDWSYVEVKAKKKEMNGRIACTFFQEKKIGGEKLCF